MDQIADVLGQNYRMNTRMPFTCEIGGSTINATLFYKKIGTPSYMAFVVDFVHPRTGQLQSEPLGSAPMHLRCAAVHVLPALVEAIKNEQLAAQTRLQDALQSATAFLEKIS